MLSHKLQEGLLARVELDSVPADVVRTFLECIYNGRLWPDIRSSHVECLLKFADMYQMPSLVKACVALLQQSVNEDNIISVLRCLAQLCNTSPTVQSAFDA